MSWPTTWDRETVRTEIEEAARCSLSVDDSLPDTLIAAAQDIGLQPVELRLWIYDEPKNGSWTANDLRAWAKRNGVTTPKREETYSE